MCKIIARLDMVELFVKKNKRNKEILKSYQHDLFYELYVLLGGKYNFEENSKGELFQSGRVKKLTNGDQNLRLAWTERDNPNDLLRIRITHRDNMDWKIHNGCIRAVGALLDIYELEYGISKAEIAFDTLDQAEGDNFAKRACLKWGRPEQLFNFNSGRKRKGGAPDAWDEYMFRRISKRQSHSYVKSYKSEATFWNEIKIYRWELRLFRKHLRGKGVETVDDLFENARKLVESAIGFKELDRRKLNKDIKCARHWRLEGKSVAEQYRMLKKHGVDASKYFNKLDWPDIYFSLDHIDSWHTPLQALYGLECFFKREGNNKEVKIYRVCHNPLNNDEFNLMEC